MTLRTSALCLVLNGSDTRTTWSYDTFSQEVHATLSEIPVEDRPDVYCLYFRADVEPRNSAWKSPWYNRVCAFRMQPDLDLSEENSDPFDPMPGESAGQLIQRFLTDYCRNESADLQSYDRKSLLVGGHGYGPIGIYPRGAFGASDNDPDSPGLKITELRSAIENSVQHLDVLIAHSCFTSSVEVAWEMRSVCDAYIGWETRLRGRMSIENWIDLFARSNEDTALEVAAAIIGREPSESTSGAIPALGAVCAIDPSRLEELREPLNNLGRVLLDHHPSHGDEIHSRRNDPHKSEIKLKFSGESWSSDIAVFCDNLIHSNRIPRPVKTAAGAVRAVLNQLGVTSASLGEQLGPYEGVSIYFPRPGSDDLTTFSKPYLQPPGPDSLEFLHHVGDWARFLRTWTQPRSGSELA